MSDAVVANAYLLLRVQRSAHNRVPCSRPGELHATPGSQHQVCLHRAGLQPFFGDPGEGYVSALHPRMPAYRYAFAVSRYHQRAGDVPVKERPSELMVHVQTVRPDDVDLQSVRRRDKVVQCDGATERDRQRHARGGRKPGNRNQLLLKGELDGERPDHLWRQLRRQDGAGQADRSPEVGIVQGAGDPDSAAGCARFQTDRCAVERGADQTYVGILQFHIGRDLPVGKHAGGSGAQRKGCAANPNLKLSDGGDEALESGVGATRKAYGDGRPGIGFISVTGRLLPLVTIGGRIGMAPVVGCNGEQLHTPRIHRRAANLQATGLQRRVRACRDRIAQAAAGGRVQVVRRERQTGSYRVPHELRFVIGAEPQPAALPAVGQRSVPHAVAEQIEGERFDLQLAAGKRDAGREDHGFVVECPVVQGYRGVPGQRPRRSRGGHAGTQVAAYGELAEPIRWDSADLRCCTQSPLVEHHVDHVAFVGAGTEQRQVCRDRTSLRAVGNVPAAGQLNAVDTQGDRFKGGAARRCMEREFGLCLSLVQERHSVEGHHVAAQRPLRCILHGPIECGGNGNRGQRRLHVNWQLRNRAAERRLSVSAVVSSQTELPADGGEPSARPMGDGDLVRPVIDGEVHNRVQPSPRRGHLGVGEHAEFSPLRSYSFHEPHPPVAVEPHPR